MVKSYSKNANHNMRRPIVNKDIVDYMRTHLKESTGHLAELEVFARKENIPTRGCCIFPIFVADLTA